MPRTLLETQISVRDAIADDYMAFREKKIDEKTAIVSARMSYAATNAARGEISVRRFENGVKLASI